MIAEDTLLEGAWYALEQAGKLMADKGKGFSYDSSKHIMWGEKEVDSLLGKLIVWDHSREAAINRMIRALNELRVEGLATTKPLHLALAADPEVRAGDFHTRWLEPWLEQNLHKLNS